MGFGQGHPAPEGLRFRASGLEHDFGADLGLQGCVSIIRADRAYKGLEALASRRCSFGVWLLMFRSAGLVLKALKRPGPRTDPVPLPGNGAEKIETARHMTLCRGDAIPDSSDMNIYLRF